MANPEHLKILDKGVEEWNLWRKNHKRIIPDLSNTDLTEKFLTNINFYKTNLFNSNLTYADLIRADLALSDLRKANLFKSDLTEASFIESELMEANLAQADVMSADFTQANLSKSILKDANFVGTKFMGANLVNANISSSFLNFVDFSYATMFSCDLQDSHLHNVSFHSSELIKCNFHNSEFSEVLLSNIDLSECIGLETVTHFGPSSIGVDTIFMSKGKIPFDFLRMAGIPKEFIEYLPSFLYQPFQFYTCFISHSSKDKGFSERLYNDLQGNAVRCWYFPEDAKWGNPVWSEIDKSIKIYDKLMVVCSQDSLQSNPVLREIERALQREDKENKNILFPITIDKFIFEKWEHPRKADVLEKVVGDFIGWDSNIEKYNKSFRKLLDGLKETPLTI